MDKIIKGTIEVHTGHGNLEQVDLIGRRKLMKHDRYIDSSTMPILVDLKPAEFKILFKMFILSNKQNFVADKALEVDFTRMTKTEAIKELVRLDLIRKAIMVRGVKTLVKGYFINPFHFRKTRQTEQYFELLEEYNSFKDDEIKMLMLKPKLQIMEEEKELSDELNKNEK